MPLAVVVALALPRVVEALWSGVARLELHRLDGRSPALAYRWVVAALTAAQPETVAAEEEAVVVDQQTILSPLAARCWPKQRCFGNNGQQLEPSNRRTEPSLRPTPPDRLYGDGDFPEELLRAALCCQN